MLEAAKLPGSLKKGRRELYVITLDQEDALTEEGHDVHVIPAWKWLD